jgi:hypothetical protein
LLCVVAPAVMAGITGRAERGQGDATVTASPGRQAEG